MPERSGFPWAVRGARALKSGLPTAVLGTPGVGYFTHWPWTGARANKTVGRIRIKNDYRISHGWTRMHTDWADMNPRAGVHIARVKQNAIDYWNWPVKVISAQRGTSLGAAAGRAHSRFARGQPGPL